MLPDIIAAFQDTSQEATATIANATALISSLAPESAVHDGLEDLHRDPPQPVAVFAYTASSPVTSVSALQQDEPEFVAPGVSIPASLFFDALQDFVADQHQLAPIVSIAGYTDFKHRFGSL